MPVEKIPESGFSDNLIFYWTMWATWAGVFVTGWFLWLQNRLLKQQNSLIENQKDLNKLLIDRESSSVQEERVRIFVRKIGVNAITNDEEIDQEFRRLQDAGINYDELRWVAEDIFKDVNGSLYIRTYKKLKESGSRITRQRAIDAVQFPKEIKKEEKV